MRSTVFFGVNLFALNLKALVSKLILRFLQRYHRVRLVKERRVSVDVSRIEKTLMKRTPRIR